MNKVDIGIEVDESFYDSVVKKVSKKLNKDKEEVEYGLKFLMARKFSEDLRELKSDDASEELLDDLELAILHSKQEK